MKRKLTDQEKFWMGELGDKYTARTQLDYNLRIEFFSKILSKTYGVKSICDLGANKGKSLRALRSISRNYDLTGVEINKKAFKALTKVKDVSAIHSSILDFSPSRKYDLVLICGVLIHIDPEALSKAYRKMLAISNRYILVVEYFNPNPVEVDYRGHREKLFKRDFGSELMDQAKGKMKVVDYGFLWSKVFPVWGDSNWWLFEKTSGK